jgi:hypothetical protein
MVEVMCVDGITATGKMCLGCDQYKRFDEYYRKSRAVDGRDTQCKACNSIKQKKRRAGKTLCRTSITPVDNLLSNEWLRRAM